MTSCAQNHHERFFYVRKFNHRLLLNNRHPLPEIVQE
jgi:hypothetical protein